MGAQGVSSLNFGAYPGAMEVSLDVTGQTGFVSTSDVEAWIIPKATTHHSIDEHRYEELSVMAVYKVDGTLTIYGRCTANGPRSTNGNKLYGIFNIGWVWN
jgi:hypothetical protein